MEKQRLFASFIYVFVYFITKQWFARFLKNVYYQSYQQHVHYGSIALCAFGTSVILSFMLSPPCSPTLCVTFICSRLTLSLQIPEEPSFANSLKTNASSVTKNIDTYSSDFSPKKPIITYIYHPCNQLITKHLQNTKVKGAYLDSKRALVTLQLTPF